MKTRILGSVVAGALAIGVAVTITGLDDEPTATPDETIREVHTLAVTDLADDRKLVGLADDVFVATVVRERGRTTGELPETQFDVHVVRAIKGSLTGDVVVSQQGGHDEKGTAIAVDGDAALEVGKTYLFASLTNETTGWHTLIPLYGTLSADSSGTKAALLDRFETAELTELPYSPRG